MDKDKCIKKIVNALNDSFDNIDMELDYSEVNNTIIGHVEDEEFRVSLTLDTTTSVTSNNSKITDKIITIINSCFGKKSDLKCAIDIDGTVSYSGYWNANNNPLLSLKALKSSLIISGKLHHKDIKMLSASIYDEETETYESIPQSDLVLEKTPIEDLLCSLFLNECEEEIDEYEQLDEDDVKDSNPLEFLEELLDLKRDKRIPDDINLIRGIYPGELSGIANEVDTLNEIQTYHLVRNAINEEEFNSTVPFADKRSPEELKEMSYAKDFAIYQTRRFGTNIPEAEAGKPLQLTEEFYDFMDYYDSFYSSFDKYERDEYSIRKTLGLDTSMFDPSYLWSDSKQLIRK